MVAAVGSGWLRWKGLGGCDGRVWVAAVRGSGWLWREGLGGRGGRVWLVAVEGSGWLPEGLGGCGRVWLVLQLQLQP